MQLGLFDTLSVYDDDCLSNEEVYERLSDRFHIPDSAFKEKVPVGKAKQPVSVLQRSVRWHQQTLKHAGLLKRVDRGQWQRTGKKKEFTELVNRQVVIAYSVERGLALWGDMRDTVETIDRPIHLYFSSPPYPLSRPRAYGNVSEKEFVGWLCDMLAPVVDRMAIGGSIVLNLSNDIFLPGSPARSTYCERLVLELFDRFGLYKTDMVSWISNKAPGPIHWSQRNHVLQHTGWEPLYAFSREPAAVFSDHRRMTGVDGLARNVWHISNTCSENRKVLDYAKATGLPPHPAMFPKQLARRAIEFWTKPGQLVVDLMTGSDGTGKAAWELGRESVTGDARAQYLLQGSSRWTRHSHPIDINPELIKACA